MTVAASRAGVDDRGSVWLRVVEVVLLVNALPAFVVLSSFAGRTETLFVWTVKPEASARLLAAMYGNAAILALLTLTRRAWSDVRVAFVVFTLFSVAATIVTFFHLHPFLDHARYFFAYWLVNYFFLCIATPIVFAREERAHGGRLPVAIPLSPAARVAAGLAALVCLFAGVVLFVGPGFVDHLWPWPISPLVARIIGVWLTALAAAFLFACWDGDAHRSRPIFVQALPTAVLLAIVPLVRHTDLAGGASHDVLFGTLVAVLAVAGVFALPALGEAGRR
jgi:hypothetical protein